MANKYWLGGTSSTETDWNVAGNWSPSGVPTTSDDVFIEANPSGTDYNIAASLATPAAVNFASFNVAKSYSGTIGTTAEYLQIGKINTSVNIGYKHGSGSYSGATAIKLRIADADPCAINVDDASTVGYGGYGSVQIVHANAASVLSVNGGYVSVSSNPIDTASRFAVVNVSGGILDMGTAVTNAVVNVKGGTAYLNSAATTLNLYGGTLTSNGTGAYTTINVNTGASYVSNSTGTITTLNVSGTADFSQDPQAKTVTTIYAFPKFNLNLATGVLNSVTVTNGVIFSSCSITDGRLSLNQGQTVKFS